LIQAAFDTSASHAAFALYKDGQCLLSLTRECQRGASKLLPWIQELIKEHGLTVADVNEWFVGIGPGSFTGLRVGISFVKGICYGSGAKYKGLNSGLAYLSAVDLVPGEKVNVLHDGRKQEVICNVFEKTETSWKEISTEVLKIIDLPARLGEWDSLVSLMDKEVFPDECQQSLMQIETLDSANFIKCNEEMPSSIEEMESSCDPIYVRPAVFIDPIKLKRKHK